MLQHATGPCLLPRTSQNPQTCITLMYYALLSGTKRLPTVYNMNDFAKVNFSGYDYYYFLKKTTLLSSALHRISQCYREGAVVTGDTNKVQRKSIALSRVLIIGSKPAQALVGGLSMVHSVKYPQRCLRKQGTHTQAYV